MGDNCVPPATGAATYGRPTSTLPPPARACAAHGAGTVPEPPELVGSRLVSALVYSAETTPRPTPGGTVRLTRFWPPLCASGAVGVAGECASNSAVSTVRCSPWTRAIHASAWAQWSPLTIVPQSSASGPS